MEESSSSSLHGDDNNNKDSVVDPVEEAVLALEEQTPREHSARPGMQRRGGARFVVSGLAQDWNSPHSELNDVERKHGRHSWQAKAFRHIHSQRFQHLLMAALLLDVLILFAEIFLNAEYPPCYIIEENAKSCCQPDGGNTTHGEGERSLFVRWLAEEGHDEGICQDGLVPSGPAGCNTHQHENIHTAHKVLYSLTLCILTVFFVELVVLLLVLGFRKFFNNRLYVLDLFIVSASLALEITFGIMDEDDLASLAGLLIIGRVWRFVRIGHGLFASTLEVSLEKVEELNHQIDELKRMLEESESNNIETNAQQGVEDKQ